MLTLDLPDFRGRPILVVGDVMLDRYWHGGTDRISPEAPVPVVRVNREEQRAGGAGNVALNLAALGCRGTLCALVGDDEAGRSLEHHLEERGVACRFERVSSHPTITKLRVIGRHQQLIRLDFEEAFSGFHAELPAGFEAALAEAELLLLSDYAKGTLQQVQPLIQAARAAGKPVLVDPKGHDFRRYRGATLITPNLSEFEAVVGRCGSDEEIVTRGRNLLAECELTALLVTRGERGMTLIERDREARHLPTHAREVFDVTGAGDTVISVLAAGLAAGLPLEAATHLANIGAGIVVGKLGTATVTLDELRHALSAQEVVQRGIVTEEALVTAVAAAKARGESVVLTNGCFDILHAGHVTYLEQAGNLGDRLIVAVNVDETVRRLKGADRPVNTLERRMTVLAALGCVDWVVPFSEETPERLICRLKPDLLVKGGDNDPDKIPGNRCVREAGGEVRVLSYLDNCSTTGLIAGIRSQDAGAR